MRGSEVAVRMAGGGSTHLDKRFLRGTHRLIPPEQTVARVRPLMPVMGITRIANVTGLDILGVPVVMVTRPNSRSISVAQGKGITLDAARASGLMEAVESYHAERISLPLKLGSYEEMRYTHRCIDLDRLPRRASGRFSPHLQMLWLEGRDLLTDRLVWLPYEVVHLNLTLPLPPGQGCFLAGSNGLASGNHLVEAIVHGVCEVIERDSMTLWHQLGEAAQDARQIDLATVDSPVVQEIVSLFRRAEVAMAVWDVTSDTGVPAFLCRTLPATAPPYTGIRPATGMGCHPSRDIALLRALTEAAQSRLTFIAGARDDMPRHEYEAQLAPATHASWAGRVRAAGVRRFGDVPDTRFADLGEELDWLLERLVAIGIEEVVVVDLTRPEFGFPIARIVIPGLEGVDSVPDYVLGRRGRAAAAGRQAAA